MPGVRNVGPDWRRAAVWSGMAGVWELGAGPGYGAAGLRTAGFGMAGSGLGRIADDRSQGGTPTPGSSASTRQNQDLGRVGKGGYLDM